MSEVTLLKPGSPLETVRHPRDENRWKHLLRFHTISVSWAWQAASLITEY